MTEQERFDRCLAEVLRLEGGYTDNPDDPGGPTNFGITQATLATAWGRPATAKDVAALTVADVAEIYRTRYWAKTRCGELPAGLDLAVVDTAVNMGPETAVRLLQRALGVSADGVVGSATLARVEAAPIASVIRTLSEMRRSRYRALVKFEAFGKGWLRRVDAVETLSLAWASGT